MCFTEPPSAPEKPTPSEVAIDSLTLYWKTPDDGNDKIIEYILEYRETKITKWTQITQITDTSYKVEKLKTNTDYVFRVIARNSVGTSPPSDETDVIRVTPAAGNEKPTIIDTLVDRTIGLSEELTLSAVIGGIPTPNITWYRNEKEIIETENITYENRVTKLYIKTTTIETEATYKCVARNDFGTAETKCRVTVEEKPKVIVEEKLINQKLRKGTTYRVTATVTGIPEPEIVWRKDQTIVSTRDERIQITREKNVTTLEITNIKRVHSGKYSITATNNAGESTVDVKLNVIDKPERPTALDIVEIKKDAVVLGEYMVNLHSL